MKSEKVKAKSEKGKVKNCGIFHPVGNRLFDYSINRLMDCKTAGRKSAKSALLTSSLLLLTLLSGCVYKGAKVTEGTDLAIGLNVPMSEGTLQLQVLNYLSGFRLGVDRNAILTCRYTVAETNSYLGVVQTHVTKTMDATVQPCEISPAETNATTTTTSP